MTVDEVRARATMHAGGPDTPPSAVRCECRGECGEPHITGRCYVIEGQPLHVCRGNHPAGAEPAAFVFGERALCPRCAPASGAVAS